MNKFKAKLTNPNRLLRYTNKPLKEIMRRLNNPRKKSIPVFLIGCGRSGTNMLTNGLAKSVQIKLYNEDNPAAFDKWRIKNFSIIERLNSSGYARVKLYKPILDTHMAQEYLSYFDNAKIIFTSRYYSDVINSSIKKFGIDNWPFRVKRWIEDDFAEFASAPPPDITKKYIKSRWKSNLSAQSAIALYWIFYNRLYFDLGLDKSERVIFMNYEKVVTQPSIEFRKLCEFIGVNYTSHMTEGIYSSSISHNPSPLIEDSIKEDCEYLWKMINEKVKVKKTHLMTTSLQLD